MSRPLESRLFPWALALSALAHAAIPYLPGSDAKNPPEFKVEERVATEPMTVRILTPEREVAPTPVPLAPDPLMTSREGSRVVEAIDFEPQSFERRERAPREVERIMAEEPPPEDIEPEPELERLPDPEPPQEEEPPPPEEIELPKKKETPERDVDIPAGPVEQVAQSGVTTRAAPVGRGNRAPRYPRRARAAKMQGTTELAVTVRSDGSVEKLEIHKSSGFSILDDEALKAVKRWKFTPAKAASGGSTTDRVIVPVRFRLKDR